MKDIRLKEEKKNKNKNKKAEEEAQVTASAHRQNATWFTTALRL